MTLAQNLLLTLSVKKIKMKHKTSNFQIRRIFLLPAFIFLISLNITAQEREIVSKLHNVDDFSELYLEGSFGVELVQGETTSVEIRAADEKAFGYLKIKNEDGLLHLTVDRRPFDFSKVNLLITFSDIEKLHIYGGIKLATHGFLDLDDIEILVEGSARADLKLKADYVSIDNRGGVISKLSGIAETLEARIAGAGNLNAGDLKADNVNIRIEGVGTGLVNATETLNASIKGAGKIKYRGNPEITEKIEGLGAVNPE